MRGLVLRTDIFFVAGCIFLLRGFKMGVIRSYAHWRILENPFDTRTTYVLYVYSNEYHAVIGREDDSEDTGVCPPEGAFPERVAASLMNSLTHTENVESVCEEFTRNALEYGGQSAPGYRFDREEAHRR